MFIITHKPSSKFFFRNLTLISLFKLHSLTSQTNVTLLPFGSGLSKFYQNYLGSQTPHNVNEETNMITFFHNHTKLCHGYKILIIFFHHTNSKSISENYYILLPLIQKKTSSLYYTYHFSFQASKTSFVLKMIY